MRLKDIIDKFEAGTITKADVINYGDDRIKAELVGAYIDNISKSSNNASLQGWQDFADAATQVTPLSQTNVLGGSVQLTTDSNGTLTDGNTTTNSEHTLQGVNDIWNSTSNTIQIGGTGLQVNDMIDARIHFEISPNIIPQEFNLVLEFFDGLDGTGTKVFDLLSDIQAFVSNAGTYTELILERRFFIGDSVKDGSCVVSLEGSASFEVKMKGFNFEIRR